MPSRRIAVVISTIVLILAACGGGGTAGGSPSAGASGGGGTTGGSPDDMLARIKSNGVIRVATDSNYAPQSFLKPDGTGEGFDIDVANEIAKRLGVTTEIQYPQWSVIEGGNWADRFDISVGSMTVTEKRKNEIFDMTQPYYFTPAQMSVISDSGITSLDGLAGKVICTGENTTYWQWIQGTLTLGDGSALAPVPEGATATTFPTDQDCAQSAQSGRRDFDGFLTSSTTLKAAIDAGAPLTLVGDPVYFEPLAIAIDRASPPHAELVAEIDKIIGEMHADGTLTALSKKWFDGLDLTVKQ